MKSLLLLIEGDDELRPVVKELQATPVNGAPGSFEGTLSNNTKVIALTTGVGPEQAYRVTADAIRQFAPILCSLPGPVARWFRVSRSRIGW